jgi:anti-sigma factor (TIGR02949 family)
MECDEVLIRLWEYLDQELGPEEASSVGEHLNDCPSCLPAYCHNRALLALLDRQRHSCSAPPSLIVWVRRCFSSDG